VIFLTNSGFHMFEYEIVDIKPLSAKKIGKISIQKYEVTYMSLLKKHSVTVELLRYKSKKAIVADEDFARHSDFISYLADRLNVPIITPSEIPRFVSNP